MAGFKLPNLIPSSLVLFTALCCGTFRTSHAQQILSAVLPDSPGSIAAKTSDPASDFSSSVEATASEGPQSTTPPAQPPATPQTKRILGIVPNFRSVSA